ncbi:hypothetical protein GCM10008940_34920 [Microbulbifer agarilyticus]
MNQVKIESPLFYGEEDENIFFLCIYNLPDFKEVKGEGTVLTISFEGVVSESASSLIAILCRRWNTNICG